MARRSKIPGVQLDRPTLGETMPNPIMHPGFGPAGGGRGIRPLPRERSLAPTSSRYSRPERTTGETFQRPDVTPPTARVQSVRDPVNQSLTITYDGSPLGEIRPVGKDNFRLSSDYAQGKFKTENDALEHLISVFEREMEKIVRWAGQGKKPPWTR